MAASALLRAETYLRGRLGESPALAALVGRRIYKDNADEDTEYPCVVFAYQDGSYQKVVGGARLLTELTYAVRAIVKHPVEVADLADAIASAFDGLLENDSAPPVLLVECETPLNRHYEENGVIFDERGGLYRILVQGG